MKRLCSLLLIICFLLSLPFSAMAAESLITDQFRDINPKNWYYNAITYACDEAKLFEGTSSTAFSPGASMTRAMFVTVLGRKVGIDPAEYHGSDFSDVKEGLWFSPYIKWASEAGLVTGVDINHFRPYSAITRQDMAVLLYRFALRTDNVDSYRDNALSSYPDRAAVSAHAETAMKWAVTQGVISGYGMPLQLHPKELSTRAQVAQIFYNTRFLLVHTELCPLNPDFTTRDIMVISHRGMPSEAPDHSFEGYDRAIAAGSSHIEQDLYLSKDGVLVVSHGADLHEATGWAYEGEIESMNWEDIRQARLPNGENIHSLEEVFQRYGASVNYVIETRDPRTRNYAAEDELTRLVQEYGLASHVTIQSFYFDSLVYMRKRYPSMFSLILLNETNSADKLPAKFLNSEDLDSYAFDFSQISEELVKRIHDKGKKVFVYNVDNTSSEKIARVNMVKIINMGVDGFFTDYTRLALELVDQAHGFS